MTAPKLPDQSVVSAAHRRTASWSLTTKSSGSSGLITKCLSRPDRLRIVTLFQNFREDQFSWMSAPRRCTSSMSASGRRRITRPRISTSIAVGRSEEHTSELQSPCNLVCRLLLEKKKKDSRRLSLLLTRTYV